MSNITAPYWVYFLKGEENSTEMLKMDGKEMVRKRKYTR